MNNAGITHLRDFGAFQVNIVPRNARDESGVNGRGGTETNGQQAKCSLTRFHRSLLESHCSQESSPKMALRWLGESEPLPKDLLLCLSRTVAVDNALLPGKGGSLGAISHMQLAKDVAHVPLDSLLTDT